MNSPEVFLAGLAMIAGLAGTVVPLVPGLPLIWATALIYGIATRFDALAWVAMVLITVLLAAGMIAKLVIPQRRVTAGGAPTSTLVAGAIAGLIGLFVIPVVGLPVGAVGGVLLAEYRRTGDWTRARRSTRDFIVGFGIGTLVEIGAGLAMVATWVGWVVLQGGG